MRAESAVEPTKSENITVTWRRSADVSPAAVSGPWALSFLTCVPSFAIALRMRRRWPALDTPISFSTWSST